MGVFRINKNSNYSVMSNYHFKDKSLSLAAKGLLSLMLSLPEDWNYTIAGLATLNSDGVDKIKTVLKELEKKGYLKRTQTHTPDGRMGSMIYDIFECPQTGENIEKLENTKSSPLVENPPTVNPLTETPLTENPLTDNPLTGKPIVEKPVQLNTYISNTNKSITYQSKERKKALETTKLDSHSPRRKSFNDIIEEKYDNRDLQVALKSYIQMRLANNFKLTNQVLILMLEQLDNYAPYSDDDKILIVKNATIGGYKTFYPVNQKEKNAIEAIQNAKDSYDEYLRSIEPEKVDERDTRTIRMTLSSHN